MEGRVDLVGPVVSHEVVVDGWRVPFLQAHPRNGGRVELVLDYRYGLDLSVEEMDRVVPFLADAIAVAMGYTCHPREDWDAPRTGHPIFRMTPLFPEAENLA
jgi:hypothetical protein